MKSRRSQTCIAVITQKNNKLLMAGDRRIGFGGTQYDSAVLSKVVKRDGMIFGGAGDGFLSDIICYIMPIPQSMSGQNSFEYMHGPFYQALTVTLKERNIDFSSSASPDVEASVLVGIGPDLYMVNVSGDRGIYLDPLATPFAIGCGGDYALAALKALSTKEGLTKKELKKAMEVAASMSSGCDDDIDYVEGE